jgi:hypothetical protein
MARLSELSRVPEAITTEAAQWYQEDATQIPNAFRSDCNWHRCVLDSDGSITVYNYAVW